jgi:hypothetical protein
MAPRATLQLRRADSVDLLMDHAKIDHAKLVRAHGLGKPF